MYKDYFEDFFPYYTKGWGVLSIIFCLEIFYFLMIWYDEIIFFKWFFCFYYSQFHFGFHVAVLAIEDFFRLESWVFLLRSLCQFYLDLTFYDVCSVCLLCSIFANLFSVFNVVGCRTFFDRIRSLLQTPQTELAIHMIKSVLKKAHILYYLWSYVKLG